VNLKQERVFTTVILFCICLQLAQSVHTSWFDYAATVTQGSAADTSVLFARPTILYAPDAYRPAIPALIRFTAGIFHIHDFGWAAALSDFVAGFLSLYLLYLLTVNFSSGKPSTPKDRALRILFFLAIIQFPIAWVVPWQRPETLPSALYLAISLFSLARAGTNRLWLLAILVATLWQAFVRADVPFVFGVAIVLVGLWTGTRKGFQVSHTYIFAGGLVALISGAIQAYMQFIRYPHLDYPPGFKVVQLRANLVPHNLEILTIALLPFIAFFVFLIVKRPALNALDTVVIASSVLYLPLWFSVGSIAEVRIFVPFLLALSMVVARVSASYISRESSSDS
jgi:hypothetical protein